MPAGAVYETLHGFDHNALYERPDGGWWTPALSFLEH